MTGSLFSDFWPCYFQTADALFLHTQLSASVQRYARRGRTAARMESLIRRRLERELDEARAYAHTLLERAQVARLSLQNSILYSLVIITVLTALRILIVSGASLRQDNSRRLQSHQGSERGD